MDSDISFGNSRSASEAALELKGQTFSVVNVRRSAGVQWIKQNPSSGFFVSAAAPRYCESLTI